MPEQVKFTNHDLNAEYLPFFKESKTFCKQERQIKDAVRKTTAIRQKGTELIFEDF